MTVASQHRSGPSASSRLGRVVLVVALLATLGASAAGQAQRTDAGVAPACRYADVLTKYRYQKDWYRSLLDTKYRLSSTSKPSDLVPVSRAGVSGYGSIRKLAVKDLAAMYKAAKGAGARFAVQSAYRSYSSQVATFNGWVRKVGYTKAKLASARPGHSEHQLGTALDLKTPGGAAPWYYADWGNTKAGAWLRKHSWKYGWVLSYPKSKSPSATCYKYEPWHFRYVGRVIAAQIHAAGLAPREWLYVKGATTGWTGGGPTATPTPSPTATPEPTPTSSPTESPSSSPTESPSSSPTEPPTVAPTESPSEAPTEPPTDAPIESPVAPSPPIEAPSVPPEG